jgi:glucose/arabinose dehydrogenase
MRCYYTKRLFCVVLVVSIFVGLTGYSANAQEAPANPFATIIRAADPLTPAEQLTKFQLPTGFKIELVTSEPHIPKPINMAFDARGRLWVAGSIEYPYAAAAGKGRDTISVLEDTTGDGRYDKLTKFAEGLNIPIGLYPYKNGAVVYSIPNILFLQDKNFYCRGSDHHEQTKRLHRKYPISEQAQLHPNLLASYHRHIDELEWLSVN